MSKKQIVQLAAKYTGFPAKSKYVIVEPKIDGWRLTALVKNGKVTFATREGRTQPYTKNLAFLAKQILKLGFKRGMIDGEVIVANWNGTAAIRKEAMSPEERVLLEKTLVYHVFDYTDLNTKATQIQRSIALEKITGRGSRNVRPVPQRVARNDKEVQAFYAKALANGFEGVIVKLPDAVYQQRRTTNWLKIKPTKTFDMRITGFNEGTGRLSGSLGAFVGVMRNGVKVKVGTGMSDKLRAHVWKNRKQFVGTWIEVRAQKSDVAAARHPAFLRFRKDLTGYHEADRAKAKPKFKPAPKRRQGRPAAVLLTQPGYGKIVSPSVVATAVMRLGLKFDPSKPVVRIGSELIDVATKRSALMGDRGVYRHAKASAEQVSIAKRTIAAKHGMSRVADDRSGIVKFAMQEGKRIRDANESGHLSDAEITKKFKSCIRQVNEREARKYAEGQPPDAFVDIDKAHAVCRSRFNAKYGSDTMKRVVAAMRSSGSYVKATPEHIRRKYLSCIKQMTEKNPNNKFIYATCASTMNNTYGPDAVKVALAPVRKQAAREAAETRAKKARKNPYWN